MVRVDSIRSPVTYELNKLNFTSFIYLKLFMNLQSDT